MSSPSLISVIIPNWNGKHFLAECIDSLKEQTFRDFETILVDNGSTDGSAEFVEERYGKFVRIIRNKKNLGFTGGNNVGIEAARGEYIVLLNNDTWAPPTWLNELVKATPLGPPIGMWASKVYSYYKRSQIEAVGELIYWDGLSRSRGQYEQERGQYEEMEEIFFPPDVVECTVRSSLRKLAFLMKISLPMGMMPRLGFVLDWQVGNVSMFQRPSSIIKTQGQEDNIHLSRHFMWREIASGLQSNTFLYPYYSSVSFLHFIGLPFRLMGPLLTEELPENLQKNILH